MPKLIETKADAQIKKCLDAELNFAVVAGAGSGKTTSLIESLTYIKNTSGNKLLRDNQKVVCITYTKRAVEVISQRLGWNDLFYVSTLHSFLWNEVKRFTPNIKEALRESIIPAKIEKKQKDDNGGQSKKAVSARSRIEELKSDLNSLDSVEAFIYNDTNFSNYPSGQLSHDDAIDVAAHLILENRVLQQILRQKYPYIFVDEAQDTFSNVVDALNKLCEHEGLPIVGYFGDPMQQIYDKRAGDFHGPTGSKTITKTENFRCSKSVVNLLNAFRTDVEQEPAGKNKDIEGSVLFRLVKAEEPKGERKRYSEEQINQVSIKFDQALESWDWAGNDDVKRLFLVRQMIARRLGFPKLQKLFTGDFSSSKSQENYEKGDHFLLKPFVKSLSPLIKAYEQGNTKQVLETLRKSSPTFDPTGINAQKSLTEMRALAHELTEELSKLWKTKSVSDILKYCEQNGVCKTSERLSEHLNRAPRDEDYDADLHSLDKGDWLSDQFLKMDTSEISIFVDFINENTALSTQHGVKGEEYKNVVVVFDDVEANWNNYSFTKMLIPKTSGIPTDGQEERSRKLAYVCFSRAEENLRVLLFTPDPQAAMDELISLGLCNKTQVTIAEDS